MLTARDLTLRRGPGPLFEHIEFSIFRGDKAQRGGAHGGGKSRDASRDPQTLCQWRRELEQIEQRLCAIAAERASIDAELCGSAGHRILEARKVRLARDAASLEARWMEVGTAIEEAAAQEPV
jgi:hypothetical protein